jgi:hypothetical protein
MRLPAAVHEPNTTALETHAWFLQGKGIFTGAFLSSRTLLGARGNQITRNDSLSWGRICGDASTV